MELDGEIKLSLYPWLGLEINKITIKNPQGFANPTLLYADKIAFSIKTLPLLRGKYEVDILQLHNAELNLQKNSDQKSNWDNFTSPSEDSLKQEKQENLLALGSLVLGEIDIKDTSFSWIDETAGQSYKVDGINIAIDKITDKQSINIAITSHIVSIAPAINANLQVQGIALYDSKAQTYAIRQMTATATLQGKNIPNGKTQLEFNTDILFSQKDDSLSINNLTFSALDTLIKAQFSVEHATSDTPKVSSNLSIEGENLLTILQMLEAEELLSKLRLQDKSFNLHANLNSESDQIVLSNLKAKFADTTVSGQLEMQKMGTDAMAMQGEWKVDGADLPILLQFAAKLKNDIPQLQVYAEKLSAIKQKKFSAELKFDIDLATQKIEVPIFMMQAFGIKADGHLSSQDQTKNKNIDGKLSILGEQLSPLLHALDLDAVAKTLGDISIAVDFTGKQNDLKLKPTIQAKIINKNKADQLILNADIAIDIAKQIVLAKNIHLSGLGLNLEANIKAENIKKDMNFEGNMQLMEFNLRQLMQQLQQKVPVTKDKKVLEKIALETKFSGSKNMFSLDTLSLSLDDTKINAQASVKNFTQPEFNSSIKIDSINVDRYLPPADTTSDTTDSATKNSRRPFDGLQKLKSKNTLKIDTLIVKNLQLNNIDIGLKIENGLVTLNPIDVDLYQGTHKGDSILDVRKENIQFQANTQLSNVQMQPLIKDYTQSENNKLQGLSNLSAQISAQGTNVTQLKNNLQGEASLAITEVVLELSSLQNVLQKLATILKNNILSMATNAITEEQKITATFNINEGIIKNDDLLIDTTGLNITGGINGKNILVNLRDNSISYDLNLDLANVDSKLLINCQGTIDAISSACKPDYTSIISSTGVVNIIKNLVGGDAGKLLEKIPVPTKEDNAETTKNSDPVQKIKEKAVDKLLDKLF
ncbi:AsmA protein [uncultured Candidatus Thioglobus sp.]|nr:AsmA protein [uncultured Candidatus Thioglobus sp.]